MEQNSEDWNQEWELQTHPIIILIDCGGSHNFISKELVERLQLTVQDTPYMVEVGDGHKIRCRVKCKRIVDSDTDLKIKQDFICLV